MTKEVPSFDAVQRGDGPKRDAATGERVREVKVADLVGGRQPPVRRPDRRQVSELRGNGIRKLAPVEGK